MKHSVLWVVLALATAACSNEIKSDLTVNGKPLKVSGCRNGSVYGFRGVELSGDAATLRIASTMTGEAEVVVMGGGVTGTELGKCGKFVISDQSSTINDVKNVEGKAELDCSSGGFTIKGSVTFANCH